MDRVQPAPPPVGIGLLGRSSPAPNLPVYHGPAYCDAVHRAGLGEALQVLPGSIQVCCWAPVVLGLKEPEDRFERGLAPRLAWPVAGLVLAPLDHFPGEPDLVLVRAGREALQEMVTTAGRGSLWAGHGGRLDRSAVPLFVGGKSPPQHRLVGTVNRALALLARLPAWQALTQRLFRSRAVTAGFEALISRTLADMSVCRNSTAIPLLTGRANISFFCTGGITWGHNQPQHLTSGWPWPLAQHLLAAPGEADG